MDNFQQFTQEWKEKLDKREVEDQELVVKNQRELEDFQEEKAARLAELSRVLEREEGQLKSSHAEKSRVLQQKRSAEDEEGKERSFRLLLEAAKEKRKPVAPVAIRPSLIVKIPYHERQAKGLQLILRGRESLLGQFKRIKAERLQNERNTSQVCSFTQQWVLLSYLVGVKVCSALGRFLRGISHCLTPGKTMRKVSKN